MNMPKKDKTFQINFLLLIIGITLIVCGIIWALMDNKTQMYVILTTVGGTLFGCSFTWIIEDYFRKKDERESAVDLFTKAIDIFENSSRQSDLPNEKDLRFFRKSVIHVYYSTKSEDEKLYWNYIQLDFTNCTVIGRLITEVDVSNLSKNKVDRYIVEIIRRYFNDHILVTFRQKESKDTNAISVFDPCYNSNNISYGFTVHDDWNDKWRLSPSILSFTPICTTVESGSMTDADSRKLQDMWNRKFYKNKNRSIFERYISDNNVRPAL